MASRDLSYRCVVGVAATLAVVGQATSSGMAASTLKGGAINGITVVRSVESFEATSTVFKDIPGAVATINVPAGQTWIALGRFSSETLCGSFAAEQVGGYCPMQIVSVKDGIVTSWNPDAEYDFAASAVEVAGVANWKATSFSRSTTLKGPGKYTVKVQITVSSAGIISTVDDWQMEIMTAPKL